MASEADSSSSFVGAGTRSTGAAVIARLDRIPIWSLSYLFIGIIGVGFLFTFFDIFDINVSFIQTCTQIVTGCLPGPPPGLTTAPPGLVLAADKLGLPVLLNLVGYVIGALILSPLADRFGRRDILLVTLVITGLGSLYTAFVGDYTNFIIARIITGIGVGADLALVATYINEVAPSNGRAKYTSLIFIMSSLGAFLGIWLGLWLTTPPANFPEGLPFAQAMVQVVGKLPQFAGNGWRIMYGIGALLALIGILLRFRLPESPRWLISQGRVEEADGIVTAMEQRAMKRLSNLPPVGSELHFHTGEKNATYMEVLGNPIYLRRTLLLFFGGADHYRRADHCAEWVGQFLGDGDWGDYPVHWLQPVCADGLGMVGGELSHPGTRYRLCAGGRRWACWWGCGHSADRRQHFDAWHRWHLPGDWRVPGGGGGDRPVRHVDQGDAPG